MLCPHYLDVMGRTMLPFTIRQIEAFLSLTSSGSFRMAAEDLGVSQPAISRLIKSLELQLGYALLERKPGQATHLLPAGEVFRTQAEAFMQSARALGSSRNAQMQNGVTPIRSYIGHHLLDEYVRPRLPAFYEQHPKSMLKFVSERPRSRVIRDIEAGAIDFALFTTFAGVSAPAERIGEIGSGIYAAPDYQISDLTLATINAQPFRLADVGHVRRSPAHGSDARQRHRANADCSSYKLFRRSSCGHREREVRVLLRRLRD
jgi:DNA-binding transcriptional LysR family regulator